MAAGDGPVPLIGRAAELAELRALVAGAARGEGGLAVLAGEAGIGKTRLSRELVSQSATAAVLVGRAYPDDAGAVLAPVVDALRSARRGGEQRFWEAARRRAPVLGAVIPELAAGNGAEGSAATRHVLFEAILDVVDEVADACAGPVVWLLEDLHWADPETWAFALYAARRAPLMPLALVATFRDERDRPPSALAAEDLGAAPGARLIRLGPLDQADTEALAAAIAGRSGPSGDALTELAARSGGLPLVVEELVGLAAAVDDPSATRIVRAMTARRTRRLSPAAAAVLEGAAVAGRDATVDLILALVDGAAAGHVEELLAAGLLVPDPAAPAYRVMFRHPLVAAAVAAEVPWSTARRLHAAVAAALAGHTESRPSERIARHLEAAGEPSAALEELLEGARAQRRGFNAYGASSLDLAALELMQRHSTLAAGEIRLLTRTLLDLELACRFTEAAEVGRRLWAHRDRLDPNRRPGVAADYANSLFCSGAVDEALSLVAAEVADQPARQQALGRGFHPVAAFLHMHSGNPGAAIELCDAGEEIATVRGDTMEAVGCRVLRAVSEFHQRGDRAASLAALHAVAEEAALHGGPLNHAAALQYIARIDHRAESISTAVAQWDRIHPAMGSLVRVLDGWRLYVEGRIDAVEPILDSGRTAAADSMRLWLEDVETLQAHVHLHRGEMARAAEVLGSLGSRTLPATRAALEGARGWLAWEEDRFDDCVHHLAASAEATRATGYGALWLAEMQLPLRVDALLRLGRTAEAAAAVEAGAAGRSPDAIGIAVVSVARGRLEGGAAGLASVGDSAAAASPWLAGMAELWRAEATGDVDAGRQALQVFARFGAARAAERAAALLRRLGVSITLARAAPRRRGLSAREWEVALLVAEGLSNEAIARRLFLSRATVANHVANILAKLEMGRRVQVAAWVAAQSAASPGV